MGRIHSIQPKCGRPVEPLLWTKMSHFLTLVQSSNSSSPAEQHCTQRYNKILSLRYLNTCSSCSHRLSQLALLQAQFFTIKSVWRISLLSLTCWAQSSCNLWFTKMTPLQKCLKTAFCMQLHWLEKEVWLKSMRKKLLTLLFKSFLKLQARNKVMRCTFDLVCSSIQHGHKWWSHWAGLPCLWHVQCCAAFGHACSTKRQSKESASS